MQIAGASCLRLRDIALRDGCDIEFRDGKRWVSFGDVAEFGTEKVIEMKPGMIYAIDPVVFHRVEAREEGSVTVPIKRLKKGVKDHIFIKQPTPPLGSENLRPLGQ